MRSGSHLLGLLLRLATAFLVRKRHCLADEERSVLRGGYELAVKVKGAHKKLAMGNLWMHLAVFVPDSRPLRLFGKGKQGSSFGQRVFVAYVIVFTVLVRTRPCRHFK